jgi:hypothetical protein
MKELEGLPFCPKHFDILSKKELKVIDSVITSPEHPDLSVGFHDKQVARMKSGDTCFIKTSYKEIKGEILTVMDLVSSQ